MDLWENWWKQLCSWENFEKVTITWNQSPAREASGRIISMRNLIVLSLISLDDAMQTSGRRTENGI
jgi:hypothetical protein